MRHEVNNSSRATAELLQSNFRRNVARMLNGPWNHFHKILVLVTKSLIKVVKNEFAGATKECPEGQRTAGRIRTCRK